MWLSAWTLLQTYVWAPLANTAWWDWHGFWQQSVLNWLDPRFLICFFLPLVPVLWLFPRRHFRLGIVLTSFVFLAYVFGFLFVPVWLGVCAAFYRLSERFAIEAKRTDVWRWGPPLAAIGIISFWYVLFLGLCRIVVPMEVDAWLFEHAPWLYPLGARPFSWEAVHLRYEGGLGANSPRLMDAVFFSPQTCGLVILTIRMMHYFSELKRDTIPKERRTFLNFLAFNSFAPVLPQGPIERFAEFDERAERCFERRSARDMAAGVYRIGLGLVKNLVCAVYLAPPVMELVDKYKHAPDKILSYTTLFVAMHLGTWALYLYFSGYCDVAIGIARLLGYRATENFRRPWLACSLTDMWRRWHITFSFILRDYVFLPVIRRRWSLFPSLILTFVVCGLLHNLNPSFVLAGFVMGVMVGIQQKWSRYLRDLNRHPDQVAAKVRRVLLKLQPLPRLCAWVLTMNAFAAVILIAFAGPLVLRVLWQTIQQMVGWSHGPG